MRKTKLNFYVKHIALNYKVIRVIFVSNNYWLVRSHRDRAWFTDPFELNVNGQANALQKTAYLRGISVHSNLVINSSGKLAKTID